MVAMVADMVIYETVCLRGTGRKRTEILNFRTREETVEIEWVSVVLDNYNKNGYFLTAVNSFADCKDFYLTKRID